MSEAHAQEPRTDEDIERACEDLVRARKEEHERLRFQATQSLITVAKLDDEVSKVMHAVPKAALQLAQALFVKWSLSDQETAALDLVVTVLLHTEGTS